MRTKANFFARSLFLVTAVGPVFATGPGAAFLEKTCQPCHGPKTKMGGLDLTALGFDLKAPAVFAEWVKVHDRVRDGEMPPKGMPRPDTGALNAFLKSLGEPLIAADRTRAVQQQACYAAGGPADLTAPLAEPEAWP